MNVPSPTTAKSPEICGGRYRILRQLGKGGFGVVYEVYDAERQQLVALKELSRLEPEALYQFKNEFRSLADVNHENLVALHELFVADGRWYLTMDLVEGTDFFSYTCGAPSSNDPATIHSQGSGASGYSPAARPPPSIERLRSALQELAAGVLALHTLGKLHRDLKPSNVLVTRKGRVVILDFGLVTDLALAGAEAQDEYLAGTPAYLAPELLDRSGAASVSSDWYAVGTMIYEALAGRSPFTGTFSEIVAQKLAGRPPDLRNLGPALPEDLCTLCMRMLEREPARRPTRAEIEETLDLGSVRSVRRAPAPPHLLGKLVGRRAHRLALASAYEAARSGRTVVARVHGASGMGKSTLVSAFLDELRGGAAVVIEGRCFERESVPYRALDHLIDGLTRHLLSLLPSETSACIPQDVDALARLFPVLRRIHAVASAPRAIGEPRELRRRALSSLRELLRRIGAKAPVVLHVDDLQWGDLDSAALLEDLFRPPDAPAVLFIASYRSEDVSRSDLDKALRALGSSDVREIELSPMPHAETRDLAVALLEQEGVTADPDAIAIESGGSPFFVLELVQHVKAGAGVGPGAISLSRMLMDRVARLPPHARALLETIAVAGRPIEWGLLLEATNAHGAASHEALSILRGERFVRARGATREDLVEVFHDRVREDVVARLPEAIARETHRRLAEALERSGRADPEALSLHFAMAGDRDQAREYAEIGARRAAQALAFDRAAMLYRTALDLAPAGSDGGGLQAALGDALANAGRGPEAARAYLAAVPGTSSDAVFDLRRRAAEQLLRSGHMDEGREVLRAVLEAVDLPLPETRRGTLRALFRERARLRRRGLHLSAKRPEEIAPALLRPVDACWAVSIGFAGIDVVRGALFQTLHLRLALDAGDRYRVARGFALESMSSACESGPAGVRARALSIRAHDLADALGHPHARGMATMATAYIAYADGRWRECADGFERAIGTFRAHCTGTAWEVAFSQVFALAGLWYLGSLDEVRRRAPLWLTEARARGDLYGATSFGTRFTPKLWLADDAPDAALREAREAIERWGQSGWQVPHCFAQFAETEAHLYAGDGLAAWRCVDATWQALARSLLFRAAPLLAIGRYLHAQSALAATDTGEVDLRAVAARDALVFESENKPLPSAWASLLHAGIAVRGADPSVAAERYADAERQADALGMALFAAAAMRRRGTLIGGDAGRALVQIADRRMAERGVRAPENMTRMLAP